ncbi:RNA polymerase sigma factor SigJ [Noviherbaspirillum sp. 1P10PC]|uniref:RNA polymerase sigma factor SigJ n=1 Tax=Noviherbaspirillum sp. 1P10PC TaxID=3132292 RepID=UPI0039A0536D
MEAQNSISPDGVFAGLRKRLFTTAYRMLGSRADAEDIVQDAWLRWQSADHANLQSAEAWLVTVTTRLALDRLRERKAERQSYPGWWLPEPLVEVDENTPETAAELASDVSLALLWALERLSAEERAAFLLRQAFDQDYADIAALLSKSQASCRQLVHRAQEKLRDERPRFQATPEAHRELLGAFMQAAGRGDRQAMKALLSANVAFISDGGGKTPSFHRILRGAGRIAGVFWSIENLYPGCVQYRMARINGEPGLLRYVNGTIESAQSFCIEDGRIVAVFIVRNPDKLSSAPQHFSP